MENGISSSISFPELLSVNPVSTAIIIKDPSSVRDDNMGVRTKLQWAGSTVTLCPEIADGLQELPFVSSKPDPAPILISVLPSNILKSDAHHKPASRSRPHNNVQFSDNRSETSSEQTKASKFKVVKLESKAPYFRGRWQCFDFHDRMKDVAKCAQDKLPSSAAEQSTTGGVAVTSTVTTLNTSSPLADAGVIGGEWSSVLTVNQLTLSANPSNKPSKFKVTAVQLPHNVSAIQPLPTSVVGDCPQTVKDVKVPCEQIDGNMPVQSQDSSCSSTMSLSSISQLSLAQPNQRPISAQLPVIISDSNAALSAELSRRTTIDITGTGSQEMAGLSLDNKIRQCMDLVGNHLIIAVREELSQVTGEMAQLKARLEQLEFENSALRSENIILRSSAAASVDVINRSQANRKK